MSNFNLNVYTPGGVVVSGISCEELSIPTSTGIINVLKGHTHLISELGDGILEAKVGGGQARHFTIHGGLCKVLGKEITILAKTSETPEQIDLERAQAALHKAQSRATTEVSIDIVRHQRRVARAKNRIRAANLK